MKRSYTYILLLSAFFLSCKKDATIAIENLRGKWIEQNDGSNLAIDGSVTYLFNDDNTCSKKIYNALSSSDTTFNWTYILSHDKTLVTMYDEDNFYTEQYQITKLTNNVMEWKNASPSDGNSDKRLIR